MKPNHIEQTRQKPGTAPETQLFKYYILRNGDLLSDDDYYNDVVGDDDDYDNKNHYDRNNKHNK